MFTVKGALLLARNRTICVIRSVMSARQRPADGTGLSAGDMYTSALSGTVVLTVSPSPASFSAFWMFISAGRVTLSNVLLYAARNGSLPTATYLQQQQHRGSE
jgi:hypothetical protein